jgi:hypothetical protein
VEAQVRQYFNGLVGFGFVATWAAAGLLTAFGGLLLCLALVHGPRLAAAGLGRKPRRTRPPRRLPDRGEDLPLVPDEPSLVLELGSLS